MRPTQGVHVVPAFSPERSPSAPAGAPLPTALIAAEAPARPRDGAALRGFTRPTVVDGLRLLAGVVGPVEALRLWSEASVATGVHGQDVPVEDHVRLVQHLHAHAPTAAVRAAAVSHLTRLRAHAVLARADR